MSLLAFVVPGQPLPWARARGEGADRYNDPKAERYKATVRMHALRARQVARHQAGIEWPLDGIYRLTVVMQREDWSRIDADRVLNLVADACGYDAKTKSSCLYQDDRHRFLRDARVLVADPSPVQPCLGVLVRVLAPDEHDATVAATWQQIEEAGDGQR